MTNMRNQEWSNPRQERAVQRIEAAEIRKLPILEQAEMLEGDAETLAGVLEFGQKVRELLTQFGSAEAIPHSELETIVIGSDQPAGMALALARVLERTKKEKQQRLH